MARPRKGITFHDRVRSGTVINIDLIVVGRTWSHVKAAA